MSESWRSFIAIDPGKALRAEIDHLQTRLQNKTGPGVRWVKPDQVHLTLKFLGDVAVENIDPLAQALRRACAQFRAFELILDGIGCFPSFNKPNVIWTGVGGELPVLRQLQKRIDTDAQAFAALREDRDFSPHLTIGRVKARRRSDQQRIGAVIQSTKVAVLGSVSVREVQLIRSQTLPESPVYTLIAALPLSGS